MPTKATAASVVSSDFAPVRFLRLRFPLTTPFYDGWRSDIERSILDSGCHEKCRQSRRSVLIDFSSTATKDESPHVHVKREAKIAKFWLDPVGLAVTGGFPLHELREIERLVVEHRAAWIEAWNEYFGS
jgi:hypothetical protein